jgi:hypothetical protein
VRNLLTEWGRPDLSTCACKGPKAASQRFIDRVREERVRNAYTGRSGSRMVRCLRECGYDDDGLESLRDAGALG